MNFSKWLKNEEKMKKIKHQEKIPPGVRNFQKDLSKDYKGHLEKNGTVEPWKIVTPKDN